jgi:hypothetical protein
LAALIRACEELKKERFNHWKKKRGWKRIVKAETGKLRKGF